MSEISITIKASDRYDASWISAKGNPDIIKNQLGEFFGIDPDIVKKSTGHEVMLMCQAAFQGTTAIADTLGGEVVSEEPAANKPRGGGDSPNEEEHSPDKALREAIENAKDIRSLKAIRAANPQPFEQDDDLRKAYNAKGRALKAQG